MSTDEKTIAEARALVRRSIIAPGEYDTLRRAALTLLANGRTLTYEDHGIIRFARGTWGKHLEEERGPPPSTPFDAEVSELERQVREAKAVHELRGRFFRAEVGTEFDPRAVLELSERKREAWRERRREWLAKLFRDDARVDVDS